MPNVSGSTRANGLAGVRKPDGSMPWLNSPQALKTWDVTQDCGLAMDLVVPARGGGGVAIPEVIALARRYRGIRIVLDHLLDPEPHAGDTNQGRHCAGVNPEPAERVACAARAPIPQY